MPIDLFTCTCAQLLPVAQLELGQTGQACSLPAAAARAYAASADLQIEPALAA